MTHKRMKTFAETTKRIIFATVLLLTIGACTPDDNIGDIFIDRQWTLTYIREGSVQYDNRGKKYSVQFTDDGFTATSPSGVAINGKWEANGKTRRFHCWNLQTTGSLEGDTIAGKMLKIFTEATSYSGDTNWLHINKDKNTYMQFGNN